MNETVTAVRAGELADGIRHHAAGRLDEAERVYSRLLAADPGDAEVLYLLGVLCCDMGLFEAACRLLDRALQLTPDFPEARNQLAIALCAQAGEVLLAGDPKAAATLLEASLGHRDGDAQTLNWLGLARLQLGMHAAAEQPLRAALVLDPDLHQARNNLGLTLQHRGDVDGARSCFEAVLDRDAGHHAARINLANALRIGGEPVRARRELEAVLAARPDSIDALNNLGATLQDLGQSDAALEVLGRGLELAPASASIRWNLALTQLQLGDFDRGWGNFESRWEGCEHLRHAYRFPRERAWRGESLEGRHLLLWAEQGFGDTLQFVRFARDAAARGAVVSVQVPPELAELIRSAPGVHRVVTADAALPAYDYHCPLMSLPVRLGVTCTTGSLHGAVPYLTPPADRSARWADRLADGADIRVGLAWAGSSRRHSAALTAVDARRSLAFEALRPLLAVGGCRFFSLQKTDPGAPPAHALGVARDAGLIQDHSDEWADFADTAAFMSNLDLVISVDTAVAHLAGALGKPIWLLNRHDSCWRWLTGRTDSPWYARLRQYRQPAPGAWEDAIKAAARDLAAWSSSGAEPRTPPVLE